MNSILGINDDDYIRSINDIAVSEKIISENVAGKEINKGIEDMSKKIKMKARK